LHVAAALRQRVRAGQGPVIASEKKAVFFEKKKYFLACFIGT
jgi:hypothetical protein